MHYDGEGTYYVDVYFYFLYESDDSGHGGGNDSGNNGGYTYTDFTARTVPRCDRRRWQWG